MSPSRLALALALAGCAHTPPPVVSPARNTLACAGQRREQSVPIPELGPLPSGEPVTAGIAIACDEDGVQVLDWGPDSSASYSVDGAHAMEVWEAFAVPASLDDRRLAVLMLLDRIAGSAP